jgi:hypothetical protein
LKERGIDNCDNGGGGFVNHPGPFNRKIELLAYELWQERGCPWGTPDTDWYQAEQEQTGGKPQGTLSRVARDVGTAIGTVVALVTDIKGEPMSRGSDDGGRTSCPL